MFLLVFFLGMAALSLRGAIKDTLSWYGPLFTFCDMVSVEGRGVHIFSKYRRCLKILGATQPGAKDLCISYL
jgi:hypothetical protein